jgi:hypothetical protein
MVARETTDTLQLVDLATLKVARNYSGLTGKIRRFDGDDSDIDQMQLWRRGL